MTQTNPAVMTLAPAGEPHVAEGPRVMLEILDAQRKIVACFVTDRPEWAKDQFFRNRDAAGHVYAKRKINPTVAPAA